MLEWNVIATAYDKEIAEAARLLRRFGEVERTEYYNVLVLGVEDVTRFLDALEEQTLHDASIANVVSRVVPVTDRFRFESPQEFERKALAVVDAWVPELRGRRFHVRMHRRGFKGRLSSQHEEQFLDHHLLERLQAEGRPGRICFDDPDVIVAVETVGQRAGLSRWTREQLRAHPLLKLD